MPEYKPQVKIISNGMPGGTTVEVDGKELDCVTRIEWIADVNDFPARVRLEIIGAAVEVQGKLDELNARELVG